MLLRELLKDVNILKFPQWLENMHARDIKIDHRKVEEGDVFIALSGVNSDGNTFAQEALDRGAVVVVGEKDLQVWNGIKVDDARSAYALMSKHFFGDACDDLRIIAVTGTNGKTTTCNTISNVLEMAGAKVGTIGTLGARFGQHDIDTGFTTPDPYILHKIFAQMKKEGHQFAVMEASAHALALKKLDGIKFEIGVLTNITEDHLDFFGDMDCYAQAKFKLFEEGRVKLGIIAGGKPYSKEAFDYAQVPVLSYGIGEQFDIKGKGLKKSFSSSEFVCDYLGEEIDIKTPLVGGYNIENALAAIGVCRSLGVESELVKLGMNCLTPVEGRFNVIKMGGANIIIDFAHTPDGLEKVLEAARELTEGELVVVFGCGGNRDKLKRPIMGEIASKMADEVVITSDNPRMEEPQMIIEDIQKGVNVPCKTFVNRKAAIHYVLKNAKSGQTIVIAGKGGEKYQEIKGVKYPYNDFDTVYDFFRNNIKIVENHNKNSEVDEDFDENELK